MKLNRYFLYGTENFEIISHKGQGLLFLKTHGAGGQSDHTGQNPTTMPLTMPTAITWSLVLDDHFYGFHFTRVTAPLMIVSNAMTGTQGELLPPYDNNRGQVYLQMILLCQTINILHVLFSLQGSIVCLSQ